MNLIDALGFLASAVTTFSFVPQVLRTWKTKDVSGISLSTYAVITVGVGLWLAYGWLKEDPPIIVANAVTILLTGAMTAMKLRFTPSTSTSRRLD